MKSFYKGLLSLFIGMAFFSCASTDSSVQKKTEENPNLFRIGTPIADILASKMPKFAHSVFKGALDSIPGEYYYYATDGKIDSLLKKEGEQFKTVVSITYDSPNGQNNYELKKGNETYLVNNGKLVAELDFPKLFKIYWSNGNIKESATGILYKDSQGNLTLDSGLSEAYFENGNINQQNVWKNKEPVVSKEWNENGVLITELVFPHKFVEYWDNGIEKQRIEGLVYKDSNNVFKPDSGLSEVYSKGGIVLEQNYWKNRKPITSKAWNENGVLVMDLDFQKSCLEYWNDGKIKQKMEGILYRESTEKSNLCLVDSGHSEIYSESGKLLEQNDWKDKHVVTGKLWNEDGVLIREIDFPRHIKEYYDNGNPKGVMAGILYSDDQGDFALDSGRKEFYSESGKMLEQSYWKDKQLVASKRWNESGVLISEIDFPKYYKDYYDNGKIKCERIGLSRTSPTNFEIENGTIQEYYENGKTMTLTIHTGRAQFSSKMWNENGVLIKELDYPKYFKEYWDNGNPKESLAGILYRDDRGIIHVDSGHSEIYFENQKTKESNDWENKQLIASKQWNENGILTIELEFPKYVKEYWDSGKPKSALTGIIYKNDQGDFAADSGRSEVYYENGKIKESNDWKDKLPIASKQWNENGILVAELDFPKYFKIYWSNGNPKNILTGTLYRDSPNHFSLDSGHSKIYFENGKIKEQNDWKDRQLIVSKQWNENGVLIVELNYPKYLKNYWGNGKPNQILTGILYRDNQGIIHMDSGRAEIYSESGKILEQSDWKNKHPVASRKWNENGSLSLIKIYNNNGTIKSESTGTIIEENGLFKIKDGTYNEYDLYGRVTYSATYRNFQIISEGVLGI